MGFISIYFKDLHFLPLDLKFSRSLWSLSRKVLFEKVKDFKRFLQGERE